jgi:hypothetical protein
VTSFNTIKTVENQGFLFLILQNLGAEDELKGIIRPFKTGSSQTYNATLINENLAMPR